MVNLIQGQGMSLLPDSLPFDGEGQRMMRETVSVPDRRMATSPITEKNRSTRIFAHHERRLAGENLRSQPVCGCGLPGCKDCAYAFLDQSQPVCGCGLPDAGGVFWQHGGRRNSCVDVDCQLSRVISTAIQKYFNKNHRQEKSWRWFCDSITVCTPSSGMQPQPTRRTSA